MPKSFTVADPEMDFRKLVPAIVRVALLPTSGGFGGTTPVDVGGVAVTTIVTVAAAAVVGVVPVVVVEVFTVPRLHKAVVAVVVQVPELAVAETIEEFGGCPMLPVNTTPLTGSLWL
jgi:hypothetical protein